MIFRRILQNLCMVGIAIAILLSPPALAADTSPDEAMNALFDQAFTATSEGHFETAERYWSKILEQYPHNAAVWSNRGNAKVSQHKLTEAIEDYNQAIALAPNEPDPYLNRGTALEGLQKWEDAIADYNHVLEIDPQDPLAYNNRGNAEGSLGEWEKAMTDFQQASALNPGLAIAQANYALAQYQVGQTEAAIKRFRNLVRKYPQYADMRAALTAALWAEGRLGEAESQWVSAEGLDRRYRDMQWIREVRRWPPRAIAALEQFLSLQGA
jgi:tetratricopeptide (TPR) repeat protein